MRIEPGRYSFPFQFTFPVDIPPTMQYGSSWTAYKIRYATSTLKLVH